MAVFRRRGNEPSTPPADRWAHLPQQPVSGLDQSEGLAPHGLVRSVWSEADFGVMGWHDATVWGFRVDHGPWFDPETNLDPSDRVLLDLDYITRWVHPERGERYFSFWVAPCTMVFTGVTELELGCGKASNEAGPHSLADVHAVAGGWHVESHDDFDLKVAATGFRLTFRARPTLQPGQHLDLTERGGVCFDEIPVDL